MSGLPGPAGKARRDVFRLTTAATLTITAGVSPSDPRVCAFTLNRPVSDGTALCRSADKARGFPLFEELFKLPGVVQVMAEGPRVTVARAGTTDWKTFGRDVGGAIRRAVADGRALVPPVFTAGPVGDLSEKVREALNADLNPGLAKHGGRAELVEIVKGVARVRFAGGCQGCGAAKMTLAYGIRRTLLDKVPGLKEVEDVTDHAAGEKPYYPPDAPGRSPFPSRP